MTDINNEFKNDAQLKSYLKKEANRLGISTQNTYSTFFSRLLLERLSYENYDKLYIKGSFSLISHLNTDDNYSCLIRPVTDIDIVSTEYHNEPILTLYRTMYESNDAINYELATLPVQSDSGMWKLKVVANFGNIHHPISIDFQEQSNTIYESTDSEVKPIFLRDNSFKIATPSIEEHLAEKLCIVIEDAPGAIINTRVKDFYDIYKLLGGKYDEEKLIKYFNKMIIDRNKISEDKITSCHLNSSYIKSHQEFWDNSSKRLEFLDKSVTLDEAVYTTRKVLINTLGVY